MLICKKTRVAQTQLLMMNEFSFILTYIWSPGQYLRSIQLFVFKKKHFHGCV